MSLTLGHQTIKEQMLQTLYREGSSGTFLFIGPEGVGKKKLALELAQTFLCQSSEEKPCGHCGSCKRVMELKHESLVFIEPQNGMIKIEEANNIKEFLRLQGLTSKRFIVIDNAHAMNLPFANAVLKTLEEPPEGVYFLLISHQPKSILSTIKSRSRTIRFHSLSPREVQEICSQWDYRSENLIQRGQVNLIKNFLEEDKQKTLEQTLDFLKDLLFSAEILTSTDWRYQYKDKSQFLDFLSLAPLVIRDAMLLKADANKESLIFPDNQKSISELTAVSMEKLFALHDLIQKSVQEIKWSPDPIFAVEKMIYNLNHFERNSHA